MARVSTYPTSTANAATLYGLVSGVSRQLAAAVFQQSGGMWVMDTNVLAVDPTADRVGVGTAAPAAKLHVLAATDDGLRVASASVTGSFIPSSLGGMLLQTTTSHPLIFGTVGVERMRIDTTGRVGIGTSPSVPLHVHAAAGEILRLSNTSAGERLHFFARSAAGISRIESQNASVQFGTVDVGTKVEFFTVGTVRLTIEANGRVGVSRAPTANAFEVEGTASKTAAGDWLANSDQRIKHRVRPVPEALAKLQRCNPVEFRYRAAYRRQHPSIEDRAYYGLIAQEFETVFPDYVTDSGERVPGDDDPESPNIKQVDSYPLTIVTAAAVKELHDIVREQAATIARLVARVEALERR